MRYHIYHLIFLIKIIQSISNHFFNIINNVITPTRKPNPQNFDNSNPCHRLLRRQWTFNLSLQHLERLSKVTWELHCLRVFSPSQQDERVHSPFLTTHTFFCNQSLDRFQVDALNHSHLRFQATCNVLYSKLLI